MTAPRWLALLVLLLLASGLHAQAKKRSATLDDLMKIHNINDVQLSPDGESVVYVVSVPEPKEGKYSTDLYRVPFAGGKPTRLTHAPKRDEKPRWSPDSKTIAFLSDRDGKMQVYLLPADGGEARKLTDLQGGVVDLVWSPDGKRLAVVATDPPTDEEKKRKDDKEDVLVVDQDDKSDQLHLIEVESGKSKQVTKGSEHVVHASWSPDGRSIACSVRKSPRLADLFHVDLVRVDIDSGKLAPLVRRPGFDALAKWSPDGKQIAFISHGGQFDWIANTYLFVVADGEGEPRRAGKDFDEMLNGFDPATYHWSPDGKVIFFAGDRRTDRGLVELSVESGKIRPLLNGPRIHDRFSFDRECKRVAFVIEQPGWPAEVYAATLPDLSAPRRLTTTNEHLAEVELGAVELVKWKGKDGLDIDGLLVKPVGYKEGGKYPLLTYVHGGPQGKFVRAFTPQRTSVVQGEPFGVQVLAGKGFAVFCPNPRGSGGYGEKFRTANVNDWGFGDFDDILAGVDHLVAKGIADADRLGIMGWSYGGYMTGWAITRTDRFKAASAGAGVYNLVSMYGTSDIPPFMERYFLGHPWQVRQTYEKHSSIYNADKIKTPTLIQHGDKDLRVPLSQSQELYAALKKRKVPVVFEVYPRQAHGISEPRLQREVMRRNVEWFEKWLKK